MDSYIGQHTGISSRRGYNQSALDTVSVFKKIGANMGVLSGLLMALLITKLEHIVHHLASFCSGLLVVYLARSTQIFIGYFLLWFSITIS